MLRLFQAQIFPSPITYTASPTYIIEHSYHFFKWIKANKVASIISIGKLHNQNGYYLLLFMTKIEILLPKIWTLCCPTKIVYLKLILGIVEYFTNDDIIIISSVTVA